jgi:hypothetical protein
MEWLLCGKNPMTNFLLRARHLSTSNKFFPCKWSVSVDIDKNYEDDVQRNDDERDTGRNLLVRNKI